MSHFIFRRLSAILMLLLILFALVGPAAAAPRNYIVVFTFDDETYYKKSVPRFTVMTEIETPEKEGYVFAGWYLDRNYTQLYDFNQPVNEPFYLYAKWIPNNSTEAVSWSDLNPGSTAGTASNAAETNTSGSASNNSSSGSGSNAVLPIPSETINKSPAPGRPDIPNPVESLPSPQTLAFLIIAGFGAAIVAYFLLLKN